MAFVNFNVDHIPLLSAKAAEGSGLVHAEGGEGSDLLPSVVSHVSATNLGLKLAAV